MKGPQLSALIWLANLVVLAGGAFAGYRFYSEVEDDRTRVLKRVEQPETKEPRKSWTQSQDASTVENHKYYSNTLLSPKKRPDAVSISPSGSTLEKPTTLTGRGGSGDPKSYIWSIQGTTPQGVDLSSKSGKSVQLRFTKATPQESTVTVRAANGQTGEFADAKYTLNFTEIIEPEPTDEELKAELEKWLNEQFAVLRLYAGHETVAKATVKSVEAKSNLMFKKGLHFSEYKEATDDNVKKLAKHDLEVLEIGWDHVLMKGPSRNAKFKDRYYEVKLAPNPKAFEPPDPDKLGKSVTTPQTKLKLPEETPPDPRIEVEDTRPKESVYDESTGIWTLGTDDFLNVNPDDYARYAKVIPNVGIQITDDIPEDHTVVSRGGRKGDIIKAINGKPVASMSDVRRIVRTEYNAGVLEFTVTYERDGVPGTKIFKAPPKKNDD